MNPTTQPAPAAVNAIACLPTAPMTATVRHDTPRTLRQQAVAARVAITAILAYQAISVAAIVVNSQWNPLTRQLSDYALGRQSWLQITAFLACAASYAALAPLFQ